MNQPARAVILVEGASDQVALQTLALRRGVDLRAASVTVVPMGGATNIRQYLDQLGPSGAGARVSGLCDEGEAHAYARRLERAGLGRDLDRAGMEALGFFVCERDLEDELIRALGTDSVERIVDDQGELSSLRTFQKQAAQQGRTAEAQLRRFMGTRSGRKIHYARVLVEAIDLDRVPRPLDGVLDHALRPPAAR